MIKFFLAILSFGMFAVETSVGADPSVPAEPAAAPDVPVEVEKAAGVDPTADDLSPVSETTTDTAADPEPPETMPTPVEANVPSTDSAPIATPQAEVTDETAPAVALTPEEQAADAHAAITAQADAVAASAASEYAPVTDGVVIAPAAHESAKDYFAGILAKLHTFEQEGVEELKADLHAIGTLLHLHSAASSEADSTGSYSA